MTQCTEANLRAAMAGGGLVTFACDGTIILTDTITNSVDATLDGSGHQVTISGGNLMRVFYAATNSGLTLIHLTVANGRSTNGAGIFNAGGIVTLRDTTFLGNVATNAIPAFEGNGRGGSIFNQGGNLTAANCLFAGNVAGNGALDSVLGGEPIPGMGGAICNMAGVAMLDHCVFTSNTVHGSDGSSFTSVNEGGEGLGGAIYNSGTLVAGACSFKQNSAVGGTGAEGLSNTLYPTTGGWGGNALGGAICNNGSLLVNQNLFASNSSLGGAGGRGGSGTLVIGFYTDQSGRSGGSGGNGWGGAIHNSGTTVAINCTSAYNLGSGGVGGEGGYAGVFAWNPHGQGIGFPGGTGGNGGTGYASIVGGGTVQMANSTVVANSGMAGTGGLGGWGSLGLPNGAPGTNGNAYGGLEGGSLVNTLLATNQPGGNCFGTLVDFGHNLSSDASCAFTNIGSLNNTDPLLGPLAANGGPTLTMALSLASPALNAADNTSAPPIDQRGFPRPIGAAADIGAFEVGPARLQLQPALDGGLEITAFGIGGQRFCLMTSSNLATWLAVSTNQFDATGIWTYHAALPSGPVILYRLVAP